MNEPSDEQGEHPDRPARPGPFHAFEQARGAVFGVEAGRGVAIRYPQPDRGLAAARASAAIADLTPAARIEVTGKDRGALLQRISTNDLRPLRKGRLAPTIFVTPKGRIVDRVFLLDLGDSHLLVTAPGGRRRVQDWIRKYTLADDVRLRDLTGETAAFGLTGPGAEGLVRAIASWNQDALEPGGFLGSAAGAGGAIAAPLDLLPGVWAVFGPTEGVVALYGKALELGEPRGLAPIGVEESEILRVEAGIPAEGRELTEEWNPWEARLDGSLSLSKGCYTGQEVIARLRTYDKVQRRLVGLRLGAAAPPPLPQPVFDPGEGGAGREIGTLTSAVVSPALGGTIGLGFVRIASEQPGTRVVVGESRIPATVASLPFID